MIGLKGDPYLLTIGLNDIYNGVDLLENRCEEDEERSSTFLKLAQRVEVERPVCGRLSLDVTLAQRLHCRLVVRRVRGFGNGFGGGC